jgi:hypothetical protein
MAFQITRRKKAILGQKRVQKRVQKVVKKGVFGCFEAISERPILQESQIRPGFQAIPPKRGQKVTPKVTQNDTF